MLNRNLAGLVKSEDTILTQKSSGQQIAADRYRIETQIGKSWQAVHITTGNRVVIKPFASFEDVRVVEHLMKIRHPSIPRILDKIEFSSQESNEMQSNAEYLVCEYLHGQTFSEWLLNSGGQLPSEDVIPLMASAARVLSFIHEQNEPQLLHLDLKPEHLIRLPRGEVGLIDFDCARLLPTDYVCRSTIRCTAGYAAPELMQGQPLPASDIYSFGIIMLVLLTDLRVGENALPPLDDLCRNLPPAVIKIINDCVKTEPQQRFSSAAALASALEQLASNRALLCQKPQMMVPLTAKAEAGFSAVKSKAEKRGLGSTSDESGSNESGSVNANDSLLGKKSDPVEYSSQQQLIVVWDQPEVAVAIARRLANAGSKTILVDADLLNPRIDLLLDLAVTGIGQPSSEESSLELTGVSEKASPNSRPGLELALTALMRQTLLPEHFPELLQKTATPELRALTGSYLLRDYAHYDPRTLLQLFKTCRMHADRIVVRCGRFLHDSFTCLSLLAADLILIPIHAKPAEIREFNRYLDFLAAQYPFERRKVRFVIIENNPAKDLSWIMADTLCGGLLAGSITSKQLQAGIRGKVPRIKLRRSVMADELDQVLRRLGLISSYSNKARR